LDTADPPLARINSKESEAIPSEGAWLIWQLADSSFPSGGFAHSGGLEAAWQQGEVRSEAELVQFIEAQLAQAGGAAVPFVNEAYHQTRAFSDLDTLYDCFLTNHVANRGSRAQGQGFLLALSRSCDVPALQKLRDFVVRDKLPCHFATVFAQALRLLDVSHSLCLRLFLFLNLRGLIASAVRLGIAGPMAGQKLQTRLNPTAESIVLRHVNSTVDQAAQTSPLLDILQGGHDRLYSRLFQT
jgi:urease accessory protein